MSWSQAEIRELKEGKYVLIDEEPCKILSIQTSKPGKHGEAKARLDVLGVFDGQKRSIVHPVTHKIRVPAIDRRKVQVLALIGTEQVQLMDLETFETFEIPILEEARGKLTPGAEIMIIASMGKRKIAIQ